MATYQDIVDYLNENYWKGFKLVYNDPSYTNKNDDVDSYISIHIYMMSILLTLVLMKIIMLLILLLIKA